MLLKGGVGEESIPWTARRSNQSILKEIIPGYSLEGLMLKLKLQYFGHLMQRTDSLEKTLMLGKIEGRRRWKQGMTEDEMVGWQHRLDGHEFEQALGVGDGQGSLVCCSPWGRKELDTTEQLNWLIDVKKKVSFYGALWDLSLKGVNVIYYKIKSLQWPDPWEADFKKCHILWLAASSLFGVWLPTVLFITNRHLTSASTRRVRGMWLTPLREPFWIFLDSSDSQKVLVCFELKLASPHLASTDYNRV